jgi:hypothetical protein
MWLLFYAPDSKSGTGNPVRVQVPPPAPVDPQKFILQTFYMAIPSQARSEVLPTGKRLNGDLIGKMIYRLLFLRSDFHAPLVKPRLDLG